MDNVNFYSLPGNDQGWYYTPSIGENLAYFFADAAGIVELMNERFNPYSRDIMESVFAKSLIFVQLPIWRHCLATAFKKSC